MRRIQKEMTGYVLSSRTEVRVRFSEVDSMGIVWHGHYVKFMEEGREDFGRKHGISYLDIKAKGFTAPVVSISFEYKKPRRYGDTVIIETRYVDTDAAKIVFEFALHRAGGMELVATGRSVQVFLDQEGELFLTVPGFVEEWKARWGIK
jgi:acyl-CoA thioester hydrolase